MRCTVAARQAISAALLHKFMQGVKGGNNTPLVGVARNLLAEQGGPSLQARKQKNVRYAPRPATVQRTSSQHWPTSPAYGAGHYVTLCAHVHGARASAQLSVPEAANGSSKHCRANLWPLPGHSSWTQKPGTPPPGCPILPGQMSRWCVWADDEYTNNGRRPGGPVPEAARQIAFLHPNPCHAFWPLLPWPASIVRLRHPIVRQPSLVAITARTYTPPPPPLSNSSGAVISAASFWTTNALYELCVAETHRTKFLVQLFVAHNRTWSSVDARWVDPKRFRTHGP